MVPRSARFGPLEDQLADGDVEDRQPAVPEQDPLVVVLPAGSRTGDDLADLGVQRLAGQCARAQVGSQCAELARLRLPPVVDDDLVDDVEQVGVERADRAVRDQQGAGREQVGGHQRRGLDESGRLHRDVGAVEGLGDALGHDDRRVELVAQSRREGLPRLRVGGWSPGSPSRSNIASSITTFEWAVPRAPT